MVAVDLSAVTFNPDDPPHCNATGDGAQLNAVAWLNHLPSDMRESAQCACLAATRREHELGLASAPIQHERALEVIRVPETYDRNQRCASAAFTGATTCA